MKRLVISILASGAFLASCGSNSPSKSVDSTSTSAITASTQNLVGADIDEHGCKASAGYTWSEALKNCIRIFEVGVKMTAVEKTQSTQAAFIVFSKDSTQAELFLPNKETHALLQRMHPVSEPDKWVWSSDSASNGLKVFQNKEGRWVIEQDGKVIYQQV